MTRRLLASFLLVLLVAGACGGRDDPPTQTPSTTTTTRRATTSSTSQAIPPRPKVGLLGDSLLHASRAEVEQRLLGVEVRAKTAPGLTAIDARYYVDHLNVDDLAVVGISLGTNDARASSMPDLEPLEAIVQSVASAPCVRWMALADTSPDPAFNDAARRINAELERLALVHPTIAIVPWNIDVATHPEWLALDGIHYTPEGSAAFGARLGDVLSRCPALGGDGSVTPQP